METTAISQPDKALKNEQNSHRKGRIPQIVFLEYEIPTEDGHKITVLDSYRNILGRIYEKYDTEKNRFEYTFCNHEDKPQFFSADLKELKAQIFRNKPILLEQAHERRLEMKSRRILTKEPVSFAPFGFHKKTQEKTQEKNVEKKPPQKFAEKLLQDHKGKKVISPEELEKSQREWQREQELQELREGKDRGREQELSR